MYYILTHRKDFHKFFGNRQFFSHFPFLYFALIAHGLIVPSTKEDKAEEKETEIKEKTEKLEESALMDIINSVISGEDEDDIGQNDSENVTVVPDSTEMDAETENDYFNESDPEELR